MKVIVVPRNGLANRLRAMASVVFLSEFLQATAELIWAPCAAMQESPVSLFARESPWPHLLEVSGADPSIRRWLNFIPGTRRETYLASSGRAVIVGNRWGEQGAVGKLLGDIDRGYRPKTIVIVSGGNFWPQSQRAQWMESKHRLYNEIHWSSRIPTSDRLASDADVGLHLRFADLRDVAPSPSRVAKSLRSTEGRRTRSVQVFTDDVVAAAPYVEAVRGSGFTTVADPAPQDLPSSLSPIQQAASDWRRLGEMALVAHFAHSSFGEEAAVAAGRGIPIRSGRGVGRFLRATRSLG